MQSTRCENAQNSSASYNFIRCFVCCIRFMHVMRNCSCSVEARLSQTRSELGEWIMRLLLVRVRHLKLNSRANLTISLRPFAIAVDDERRCHRIASETLNLKRCKWCTGRECCASEWGAAAGWRQRVINEAQRWQTTLRLLVYIALPSHELITFVNQ